MPFFLVSQKNLSVQFLQ